jgi:hypothetical protein
VHESAVLRYLLLKISFEDALVHDIYGKNAKLAADKSFSTLSAGRRPLSSTTHHCKHYGQRQLEISTDLSAWLTDTVPAPRGDRGHLARERFKVFPAYVV